MIYHLFENVEESQLTNEMSIYYLDENNNHERERDSSS